MRLGQERSKPTMVPVSGFRANCNVWFGHRVDCHTDHYTFLRSLYDITLCSEVLEDPRRPQELINGL
jgi:hypothetical protein